MAILARSLSPRYRADAFRDADAQRWWGQVGNATTAGVSVNPETAMAISTVWACVRVIAEGLAMLPLPTYRRLGNGGKERATDHPLYELLHDQPNPWQTSFEWIEMMTGHAVLRGDGFSEIVPGPRGAVDILIPLHPDRVTPEWADDGRSIVYRVQPRDGRGRERVLLQDEMFHLRGMSSDGLRGMSVITYARETLGTTKAAELYAGSLFGKGARPSGVVEHPKTLSDMAAARIREQFTETYAGVGNAGKTVVLEEGMKWAKIGMTNEDAQFLESRRFQREEIATWFGVKPHKVGIMDRATFSNIEQQAIEHVTDTLMPWAKRWEQAIKQRLIVAKRTYFAEFLFDALLRGDTLSRWQAYRIAREIGVFNADEIREKENMNPIADGSGRDYLRPLNYVPADAPAQPTRALYERNGHHAIVGAEWAERAGALSARSRRCLWDGLGHSPRKVGGDRRAGGAAGRRGALHGRGDPAADRAGRQSRRAAPAGGAAGRGGGGRAGVRDDRAPNERDERDERRDVD